MTVTTGAMDTSAVAKKKTPASTPEGVDAELVGLLVEQARRAGLRLTGDGGLPAATADQASDRSCVGRRNHRPPRL
jgi:hypothetical protein